jgi:hypothetical protein
MTNNGLVEASRPSVLSNFDPTFGPAVDERRRSLPVMDSETNKTETYFKTFENEDSDAGDREAAQKLINFTDNSAITARQNEERIQNQ